MANSNKHGGRCIAGIDKEGNWVRPVSSSSKRAINRETRTVDGVEPKILDILDVPLHHSGPNEGCQGENRLIKDGLWQVVGQVKSTDLLKHCEDDEVVLHTHLDYVRAVCFGAIPRRDWKSLQLIRNKNVDFAKDNGKWRASFADGHGSNLNLAVTDPVACEKLERGEHRSNDCLLTVSLGPAWSLNNNNTAKRCYKFVAGVIEVD